MSEMAKQELTAWKDAVVGLMVRGVKEVVNLLPTTAIVSLFTRRDIDGNQLGPAGMAFAALGTVPTGHGGARLVSRIGEHAGLTRHASRLSGTVQESIDHLTGQLARGNMNPGIGSKHLFGGVFEARARDGARVYFRRSGGTIEVLAKSTKDNQSQVINILQELYDR